MGGARRRMHRLCLAAAGALALHALLLLGLMLLPRPPVVVPPRKVVPIDLRRISPPGRAPASEQKAPALPQPTAKAKAIPGPGPTQTPSAETPPQPAPPAWSRDWRTAEGIDGSGGLSLRLDHPERALEPGGDRQSDGSAGLVREKSPEARLAEEKAVVQKRLEGWASDVKAKARAQARDEYWQSIEDALGRGFNPAGTYSTRRRGMRRDRSFGGSSSPGRGRRRRMGGRAIRPRTPAGQARTSRCTTNSSSSPTRIAGSAV